MTGAAMGGAIRNVPSGDITPSTFYAETVTASGAVPVDGISSTKTWTGFDTPIPFITVWNGTFLAWVQTDGVTWTPLVNGGSFILSPNDTTTFKVRKNLVGHSIVGFILKNGYTGANLGSIGFDLTGT